MGDLDFVQRHMLRVLLARDMPYTPRNTMDSRILEELRVMGLVSQNNVDGPAEMWELTVAGRETQLRDLR